MKKKPIKYETSYFGNLKKLPLERCVAISRGVPVWYKGEKNKNLAPSYSLLMKGKSKQITPEEWKDQYLDQLEVFDPNEIAEQIEGKILLCWEKPSDRCHRHYVVEWLERHGVKVESSEYNTAGSSNDLGRSLFE